MGDTVSAKNIITRLREEGVLEFYFDTRAQGDSNSPGYAGTGGKSERRYVDSSGKESDDDAETRITAYAFPAVTFPQPSTDGVQFRSSAHQYLKVDNLAYPRPRYEEFTLVVLVDDMQFENSDDVNAHPDRHECAVLVNRSETAPL